MGNWRNRAFLLIAIFFGLWGSIGTLSAGWVETLDGSRINGEIILINERHVVLITAFVGRMEVPRTQVMRMEVQRPFHLRTERGEIFVGPISSDLLGRLIISDNGETHRVHWRNVASGWRLGDDDPVVREVEGEQRPQPKGVKDWKIRLSMDLRGRTGNVERFGTNVRVDAQRIGPHDRLDLYGSYRYAIQARVTAEDEIILGTRYTSFPQGKIGWFVREEVERDAFERISFRSTTAGGASFRFINEPHLKWEGSSGLAYRYENYMTGGYEHSPGLDFGMSLDWRFVHRFRLRSRVTFQPALDDFSDFYLEQDTGVELPVDARNFWRIQMGVNSKYNNRPDSAPQRFDMQYYTRFILSWE